MRSAFTILLLGVLALLIPSTVFRTTLPQAVAPNLLVILLVWVAFQRATAAGALLSFLLGLELDFCSGILLGPWAGAYVAVFGLLVLCSRRIFIESALVVFLAVFAAALVSAALYQIMLVLVYGSARLELAAALRTGVLEAAMSAAPAPLLFRLIGRGGGRAGEDAIRPFGGRGR